MAPLSLSSERNAPKARCLEKHGATNVLSIARRYDTRPAHDEIQEIKLERLIGDAYAASRLRIRSCKVWTP